MNIDSWMLSPVAIIAGISGTYAVLRSRVAKIEENEKSRVAKSEKVHDEINLKIDACFKRVDLNSEDIIRLQKDTSTHLDMVKAEETFVSKRELELHIKLLELSMTNISAKVDETNSKVDSIEGKVGDLVELLTQCRIDKK